MAGRNRKEKQSASHAHAGGSPAKAGTSTPAATGDGAGKAPTTEQSALAAANRRVTRGNSREPSPGLLQSIVTEADLNEMDVDAKAEKGGGAGGRGGGSSASQSSSSASSSSSTTRDHHDDDDPVTLGQINEIIAKQLSAFQLSFATGPLPSQPRGRGRSRSVVAGPAAPVIPAAAVVLRTAPVPRRPRAAAAG